MTRPAHLDEYNAGVLHGLELAAVWMGDQPAVGPGPAYLAVMRGILALRCPDCDVNGLIPGGRCTHPNLTSGQATS